MIEKNFDKINLNGLSKNPNAVHLIEKVSNPEILYRTTYYLSQNPNAIDFIKKNKIISWKGIFLNKNPDAINLLEEYLKTFTFKHLIKNDFYENIQYMDPHGFELYNEYNWENKYWEYLSSNPNIFTYDYVEMKKQMKEIGLAEELSEKVFHPKRLMKLCEKYNMELEELQEIF